MGCEAAQLAATLAGFRCRLPATRPIAPTSTVTKSALPNGVRVVSIDNGSSVASVGIFAKAGSRFEAVPGTAHVLEHVAFASTQRRSAAKIQYDVDAFGATVSSAAGREVLAYTGDVLREDAPALLSLISEALTQPRLKPWEVDEYKVGGRARAMAGSAGLLIESATAALPLLLSAARPGGSARGAGGQPARRSPRGHPRGGVRRVLRARPQPLRDPHGPRCDRRRGHPWPPCKPRRGQARRCRSRQ